MRAVNCCALLVVIAIPITLFGQTPLPPVNLDELRADVTNRLLNEREDPGLTVIDHLWKSNGGVLVPRNANEPAARGLAAQLAASIAYDTDSETITWPVLGFGDPQSLRFPPASLWEVLRPYFAAHFNEADARTLESNFAAERSTRVFKVDPLVPPAGLTMPAERLLALTGYSGTRLFVYSPPNCFNVAVKCWQIGLFDDARVLLSHALAQSLDPRFYYFRGTIEMLTGHPHDATMSALGFIATAPLPISGYVDYVYERINGPPAIQFRDLVTELSLR